MKTIESVKAAVGANEQQVKDKRRKTRRFYLLALTSLLIALVGSALAAGFGYRMYSAEYQSDLTLAHTGEQQLQTATSLFKTLSQNPIDSTTIDRIRQEFVAAHTTFVQLDGGLESLPGVSTLIPVYGGRLSAAIHLASAAVGLTQAGIEGCSMLSMLVAVYHDPLRAGAHGLTMADLINIDQDFQGAKDALEQAIAEASQVKPGDVQFIPQVSKMLGAFQNELPTAQTWLDTIGKLLPFLPAILGIGSTPAYYLIEVLD